MAKKHLPYVFVKRQTLEALKNKQLLAEKEISLATTFIKEIEKGNLQSDYYGEEAAEEKSELASSLMSMASKMQEISKEEKERNWATEGLAKFMDILRSQNDDTNELVDDIFRNLIRYMEMNQGALYLVNDEDPDDVFIELITCYAYNRKKHIQRKIALGEGLIGQVILEKETTYMTEIPEKYIKITSGLGEALPRNLLLVPLKIEDKVLGAIELASFKKIPDYRIQFVEKLGESIASTISAVKINQRTKYLLQESQQQAEEMKAQEEEMRQNMEELAATQEDMERAMKEIQEKENYLNNLINSSKDAIYAMDRDHKLIISNQVFNKYMEQTGLKVEKGFDMKRMSNDPQELELYDRVFAGETIEVTNEYDGNYFIVSYNPLRGPLGEVTGLVAFTKDVSEQQKLLLKSQEQAEELKAQEEEMRQNLEEMSAIQEEMERATQELQHREQYLNDLINLSKDTIFTYDKDFKVTSFNKAYADSIKGSGFEATVGMDVFQFFSEEEKEYYKQLYTRALQGESFTLNHSFGAGEGVEVHMSIQYAPLRNTEGEVMAGAVFANDVTEQIRLEMDMRAREEAVSLSTILSDADLHGTITYVNEKLCEVSGFTKEELIGQPHSIFRHPDMPKALFKAFWKTIKAGEVFRAIIKNKTKTDGHYWVDASIKPVMDKNGKILKYIGARYHITDDDIAVELYNRQAEKLGVPKL